ncbi:MAG: PepSY domain-containing protein [Paracoccaceae bacterium]
MFRTLILTAFAATLAVPAFADTAVATSTATCSTAAAAKFKSKDELTALLVKDGLTVKKIKTEKGCYEVYAIDAKGKKVNSAYNAETLDAVANVEAGEN